MNDQIICINGCSLDGLSHSEAMKTLQSAQGMVELVVLRDPPSSGPHSPHTPAPLYDGHPPPLLTTPPHTFSTPTSLPQTTPSSGLRRLHPPLAGQLLADQLGTVSCIFTMNHNSRPLNSLKTCIKSIICMSR